MKNKKQKLTTSIRKLATKIAQAYKSEIIEPAEEAIKEWLNEISSEEKIIYKDGKSTNS